jgi:hypothetical protein
MEPPTSRYGCGNEKCIACYGDQEWQKMRAKEYYEEHPEEAEPGEDEYYGS